jgi:hypothetical protein
MAAGSTGFGAFLRAFTGRWLILMSGAPSVPFALLALFLSNGSLQAVFGVLSAACALAACFLAWREERRRVLDLEERLRPKLDLVVDPTCQNCAYGDPFSGEFEWRISIGLRNPGGTTVRAVRLVLLSLRHPNGDPVEHFRTPVALGNVSELHPGGPAHAAHVPFITAVVTTGSAMVIHTEGSPSRLIRANYNGRLQAQALDVSPTEIEFTFVFDQLLGAAPTLTLGGTMRTPSASG